MKKILAICSALLALGTICAQTVVDGYHGPFVIYRADSVVIIGADCEGVPYIEANRSRPGALEVVSHDGTHRFQVNLHRHFPTPTALTKVPETLVVSDLHGNIDAFVAVLRGCGVIDADYEWSYGGNRLVFNGDALDRGRDDAAILWLLYKLEEEARIAGGEVVFLIGNHEDLVLKADLRYIHPDHKALSEAVGIPYEALYGSYSELGRWIRKKPLIAMDGKTLFVHAGLSAEMAEGSYSVSEINDMAREFVGLPRGLVELLDDRAGPVFRTNGPLWYRGLVRDDTRSPAITEPELEKVLSFYGVDTIVVGHTEVDEVHSRYNGRVIAVNVRHYQNFPANRTAGLIIAGDSFYAVDYNGRRSPL